jgi:starch phosphorylase
MNTPNPTDIHAGIPDLRKAILRHVRSSMASTWERVYPREKFFAVSYAIRDRLIDIAVDTFRRYINTDAKRVHYLSLEFLMGRALVNNLVNLGIYDECKQILTELGTDFDEVIEAEPDAALGNGGLGRLAACFLDSLATLGMPGIGYGLNYEYGMFQQQILNGQQVEHPETWRCNGTPWEVSRPEEAHVVMLMGRIEHTTDSQGNYRQKWVDCETIMGIPYAMPIIGYQGKTVNVLRLFAARDCKGFDMKIFNEGDYIKAVERKVLSETVSKVLYPSDQPEMGQMLRLVQEYFLVACSLREILQRFDSSKDITTLPEKESIQLNDTHPALAVAELMRILVDERELPWDLAWELTTKTLSYTNHTLLPEALEKWPITLLERVVPRHLQIIYEINKRFLEKIEVKYPGDEGRKQRLSIIEESNPKQVRMANLAIVGSHTINGVAAVHSELVKTRLVPDFYQLWPEKFQNKTNGVTPRRWILASNPGLSKLISSSIGDGWITQLDQLRQLEPKATNSDFQQQFMEIKHQNKLRLAQYIQKSCGVTVDDRSIFDSLAKRIHEYKRQLLDALHIVHEYLRITEDGYTPANSHTYIFSGKAAPGYYTAKQIIYLINSIANVVNKDSKSNQFMKVVFIPNYSVSVAEILIPATDLSEQISTAGFEASGTGNMKFAMNGALTIGTMDGANIEMAEEIGEENMLIFGNTVEQIRALNQNGTHPIEFYEGSDTIRRILDVFHTDRFSPGTPGEFSWVYKKLVQEWDPYFLLADLDDYIAAHAKADELYSDSSQWAMKAILNVARMGKFSSDRTIQQYADEIWKVVPVL